MRREKSISISTRTIDFIVISIFVLISIVIATGRIGNRIDHYSFSSSDAANIASFAAAWDYPEYFTNDPLLKNIDNFRYYSTLHIPLIRWLGRITGNYSTPFAIILFPFILLHLVGYFLMGKVLTKNSLLSFFLSITLLVPVSLNLGEVWGLYETIPRFLFQALLPFLLAAVIYFGKALKNWPWLMASTGLMVYIHPVSLPPWAFAILLSLLVLAEDTSWKTRVERILFSSMFFLMVITPFVFNYFASTNFGSLIDINYETVREIMLQRFNFGLVDIRVGLKDFIKITVLSSWINITIWVMVFIGGISLFIKKGISDKNWIGYILAAWWLGISIISIFFPLMDNLITTALNRTPFEVELIRNIRYFIPLLLISAFYILSELANLFKLKTKKHTMSIILFTAGFLLMYGWMLRYDFFNNASIDNTVNCWKSGELVCPLPDQNKIDQRFDLLGAISLRTPIGSRILCTEMWTDLAIRYYSLRPLVYDYKDGASFIYTNFNDLLLWWKQYRELWYIEKEIDNRKTYLDQLVWFAKENKTDFLILIEKHDSYRYLPDELKLIFGNDYYSLYKLTT